MVTCWKLPKGVRTVATTWPWPPHAVHDAGRVPLFTPVPVHVLHSSTQGPLHTAHSLHHGQGEQGHGAHAGGSTSPGRVAQHNAPVQRQQQGVGPGPGPGPTSRRMQSSSFSHPNTASRKSISRS